MIFAIESFHAGSEIETETFWLMFAIHTKCNRCKSNLKFLPQEGFVCMIVFSALHFWTTRYRYTSNHLFQKYIFIWHSDPTTIGHRSHLAGLWSDCTDSKNHLLVIWIFYQQSNLTTLLHSGTRKGDLQHFIPRLRCRKTVYMPHNK